jgi:mannose-6-phosphate isomerase
MAKRDWVSPPHRVLKPWGHEDVFALADGLYCGKVLFIKAGRSLSLQFHELKDETIAVYDGQLVLEIGRYLEKLETFHLWPGETVRILPTTLHRMTAMVDSHVLEASTTELEDVIRLADNYGRPTVVPGGPFPAAHR